MSLSVNQLGNGLYLVTRKTKIGKGYENEFPWTFRCPGQAPNFKLHVSINGVEDAHANFNFREFHEDSTITAWLEIVPDCLASDCYPVTVSAFLDGEVREMTKISSSKWSKVEWPYQPSRVESIDKIEYVVTLGLVLEFKEMHLANHYAKVLENQKMGDVKFILQEQEMTAHSDILVAASPVMAATLEPGKFIEGQTKTITISDIEPTVFQQLLRFIYTGSAPRLGEESITKPLYLAAVKYQLDSLKVICEEWLIQHLKLDNAVENYLWAKLNLVPQLEEAATKFLIKHKKNIAVRPEFEELASSHTEEFIEISSKMISGKV